MMGMKMFPLCVFAAQESTEQISFIHTAAGMVIWGYYKDRTAEQEMHVSFIANLDELPGKQIQTSRIKEAE